MKKLNCDILILGAGLTGLMTAYSLSKLKLNIFLVDKFNFVSENNNDFDLRTTAIAEGSKDFLELIQIWPKLVKFSEPIKEIKVIDRKISRSLDFYNKEKNKNLGYIVRNNIIKKNILRSIKNKKNIKLINSLALRNIFSENDFITLEFDKININARLLIAADGKNSNIRKMLKTPLFKKNYNQKALVVNFHHTKNHKSVAYELFYNSGPLAILPMKKFKKDLYTSSVIWSHKKNYINDLYKINKNMLSLILEEKIRNFIGEIKEIVDVQCFDLSAHLNSKFYENRTIYIGDSAHSIHPIAGQGWNLGVRDIKRCQAVIQKNIALGLDIGSINVCKEYHDQTYYDAYFLYQLTNSLNSIFINDSYFFNKFREQGFKLINRKNFIKNYITNFAMGF